MNMAKRRKLPSNDRYFGSGDAKSSGTADSSKKRGRYQRLKKGKDDEANDESIEMDVVDKFHNTREKKFQSNIRTIDPPLSDDEVLPIRSGESDDDDDDENASDTDNDSPADLAASDIEDEQELPSGSAWGRNRKAFYNTDYVDQDYGGFEGSDAEAAEQEEAEARSLQQKMAATFSKEDFELDFVEPVEASVGDKIETKLTGKNVDVAPIAASTTVSSEVVHLAKDFRKIARMVKKLEPIVLAVKKGEIAMNAGLRLVQLHYETCMNYLVNLNFYFYLHAAEPKVVKGKNHPVIERLVEWRMLVETVEAQCSPLNAQIDALLEKLSTGQLESLRALLVQDDSGEIGTISDKIKRSTKTTIPSRVHFAEMETDTPQGEAVDDGDAKRAITYQMAKNKGIAPKRKKEQSNPRVKHRNKFRKAQIRRRSQIPDVRHEVTRYDGEARGIKTNVVRSRKLN